jgi:hypothetical protein
MTTPDSSRNLGQKIDEFGTIKGLHQVILAFERSGHCLEENDGAFGPCGRSHRFLPGCCEFFASSELGRLVDMIDRQIAENRK